MSGLRYNDARMMEYMLTKITRLEEEAAVKNIKIESQKRELESARKTIATLYRQIDVARAVNDDQDPTNEPGDH